MATTQGMYFQTHHSSFLSVIPGLLKALGENIKNDTCVGFNSNSWSINGDIFQVIACTTVRFVLCLYHSKS